MEANFFRQIAGLNTTGNLQLTVSQVAEGRITVSVLLQNEACGDKAKTMIPPLILKGTAEEMDGAFFDKISSPLQAASGLMVNMEAFMKQLDEAKKHSAMEKEKTDKEKKVADEKERKYREAMKKVEELEKAGKYREAWVKVPEPGAFPEHTDELRKRKSELSAKFSPNLFDASAEPRANLFGDKPEPEPEPEDSEDWEDDSNSLEQEHNESW
ncbi:PRTRC system protein E [Chitinophaga eiseniae]|uniref:PRTRC system protein E n=1 Tax=Chitinophaga eiseniae TaxID=634771 RepID=A0A1T4SY53_9BACT|nr:PRTRC system protein E [Chitinophaga eiseniae]SKA33184.1 PRTRC system protein E [Chitinophaga eiseniae]